MLYVSISCMLCTGWYKIPFHAGKENFACSAGLLHVFERTQSAVLGHNNKLGNFFHLSVLFRNFPANIIQLPNVCMEEFPFPSMCVFLFAL